LIVIIRVVAIFTQALISSSRDYILLHVLIQITSSSDGPDESFGIVLLTLAALHADQLLRLATLGQYSLFEVQQLAAERNTLTEYQLNY